MIAVELSLITILDCIDNDNTKEHSIEDRMIPKTDSEGLEIPLVV